MSSFYDHKIRDIQGNLLSLAHYRGKVLLLVNTASHCGFTPQFAALQDLYNEYHRKGFELLATPSNDFMNQEPLDADALVSFCKSNYETTFPITEKIHVTGPEQHPIYRQIVEKLGPFSRPRWNFYKYMIDRNGEVVDYFVTFTKPNSNKIKRTIERLLNS
ncbi:MAG TPA: glutathione peroxidase [Saprospiraceae bacterium]|nr:redoxin domain-containing protein [Lewinellaceae bacterium]HPQ98236.1 glutathione peroxidase [Saprospiraceae bacterium]HRV85028.1 glutathione peroxidase [Saprospiraceae bacterium]